jgi:methionyl-tRNA synthetase
MLKAAGLPLYKHLNVHGYWLVRDTKMSKSLGNVVSPLDMSRHYGNDAFRYFLLREMHFGSDAGFSEEALVGRLNADLANDLGNLFSRVLSMTGKFCGGTVPQAGKDTELELNLKSLATDSLANFQALFQQTRFSVALESLWELVRALNKYVDSAAPWSLAKQGDSERLGTVLYTLLEFMRKVALHLWPVMPVKAGQMLAQLGLAFDPVAEAQAGGLRAEPESFGRLAPGTQVAAASNLFPRVELEQRAPAPEDKPRSAPKQAKTPAATEQAQAAPITFADFQKLDLRVGTVVECTQHPNADKLLRLMVDLGEGEPRQILSGIAEYFAPESLVGKRVTVVANLPPRSMRGLESQGMILTVDTGTGLTLLSAEGDIPPGGKVS